MTRSVPTVSRLTRHALKTFYLGERLHIRKLRERYPDVKIKLFTRRDFERLSHKYRLNLAS